MCKIAKKGYRHRYMYSALCNLANIADDDDSWTYDVETSSNNKNQCCSRDHLLRDQDRD